VIKAVIFDCFGVLTTDGWLPFKQKYFGRNQELMTKATKLNNLANSGLMEYKEFLEDIAQMASVAPEKVRSSVENSVANRDLLKYIKSLKLKYKIGMLSNASRNLLKELFSEDQVGLFDEIALSYETGIPKPDQRAYIDAAKVLGLQTEECVFIDDQQKHIDGAVAAGMKAILYKDFSQMKNELEQILAASSNN